MKPSIRQADLHSLREKIGADEVVFVAYTDTWYQQTRIEAVFDNTHIVLADSGSFHGYVGEQTLLNAADDYASVVLAKGKMESRRRMFLEFNDSRPDPFD